ncbi:calcium-translocating P-type ATPase, PMCA-type [Pneumocystis jirovecii RU7]|uniref:Calcium-transporting ATPase n=1 Tax=Pneumocystis jirovecii (strain RU7) TaxID=1408657 RepID=A0A0W4ZU22_PNEJ7|nr:calcium-translocating P-type ATPase, PMCA-type [Pneumocystis jirovecii RU7]KTW31877.1 calcium-translocating P-type ATPase, PMCA-type [Pneumocystis jirovecii RU7]
MSMEDYMAYEKMRKNYEAKKSTSKKSTSKRRQKSYEDYIFLEKGSNGSFSGVSVVSQNESFVSRKPRFMSKTAMRFRNLFSYIMIAFSSIVHALSLISRIMLKIKVIRVLKEIFIGKSETYEDFVNLYGDSYKTRISVFGVNRTPKHRVKGIIPLILHVFRDPILILLICATIISFAIDIYHRLQSVYGNSSGDSEHSSIDGIVILVAIVVVSLVSALNDYQKERQFEKLNAKKEDFEVKVVRSGKPTNISVYQLQVGDILLFELGDLLSADGILIDGYNVSCDESSATGESNTIEKVPCSLSLSSTSSKLIFDERYDPFMISGSKIVEGTGKCIVTSVGIHSYYEKIMTSIQTESDDTPLQIKLSKFALGIAKFGIFASLLLFNILFCRFLINYPENKGTPYEKTMSFMRILISSITIVVVALPEGLPLAITLALAFATRKMSKENNLVRHLKSCETMGNVTTICSDKTGTLTQNKMTLVIGALGLLFQFQDYSNLEIDEKNSLSNADLLDISTLSKSLNPFVKQLIIQSIAINSSAFLSIDKQGQSIFVGSKTDCALLEFAQKYLNMDNLSTERANANVLHFIPFSSSRKYMASIISLPNGGARLYIKGASEALLEYSSYIIHDPFSKELDRLCVLPLKQEDKDSIYKIISNYASMSLRTIALLYKDFDVWPISGSQVSLDNSDVSFNTVFSQMVFIGVVGIMDPLREGVKEAIKKCRDAGITVRMVTGDNKITAGAIAKSCGIHTPGGILMEGIDFRNLSSEDMNIIAPRLQVLARSSPEDKKILVSKLKELGEVVAVTGDGTNDGPALKKADVGFSMGISGTDVAKEASDIILMDDNFASIVKACAWGRAINLAIRKFLQFQMTVNLTAVLLTFITAVVSPKLKSVLNPIQLLWINLIMDAFAALALATDPPSTTILNSKPEPKALPLITFPMWKMIIGHSIYQLLITLVLYFWGDVIFKYDEKRATIGTLPTLIFNTFVFMQIFNEFNCWRLNSEASILEGIRSNPWYISINIIMVLGQVLIVSFGGNAFHVKPLNLKQWAISLSLGALSIPISKFINCIPDSFLEKILPNFIKQSLLISNGSPDNQTQWNLTSLYVKDELSVLNVFKSSTFSSSRSRRMNKFYEKLSQSINKKDTEKVKKILSKNRKLQSSTFKAATVAPAIMVGSIGGCVSNTTTENDTLLDESLRDRGVEIYSDTDSKINISQSESLKTS